MSDEKKDAASTGGQDEPQQSSAPSVTADVVAASSSRRRRRDALLRGRLEKRKGRSDDGDKEGGAGDATRSSTSNNDVHATATTTAAAAVNVGVVQEEPTLRVSEPVKVPPARSMSTGRMMTPQRQRGFAAIRNRHQRRKKPTNSDSNTTQHSDEVASTSPMPDETIASTTTKSRSQTPPSSDNTNTGEACPADTLLLTPDRNHQVQGIQNGRITSADNTPLSRTRGTTAALNALNHSPGGMPSSPRRNVVACANTMNNQPPSSPTAASNPYTVLLTPSGQEEASDADVKKGTATTPTRAERLGMLRMSHTIPLPSPKTKKGTDSTTNVETESDSLELPTTDGSRHHIVGSVLATSPRRTTMRREIIRQRMQHRKMPDGSPSSDNNGTNDNDQDGESKPEGRTEESRAHLLLPTESESRAHLLLPTEGELAANVSDPQANVEDLKKDCPAKANPSRADFGAGPIVIAKQTTFAEVGIQQTSVQDGDLSSAFDNLSIYATVDPNVPGRGCSSSGSLDKVLDEKFSTESYERAELDSDKPGTIRESTTAAIPVASASSDESLDDALNDKPSQSQDTTERAFDFRSIHEHPPQDLKGAPLSGSLVPDPCWDTNKVYFSEFADASKKDDVVLDIFEAEDLGPSAASFTTAALADNQRNFFQSQPRVFPGISNGSRVHEEKKESILSSELDEDGLASTNVVDDLLPQPPLHSYVAGNDGELDPTGWPVLQDGFLPDQHPDPFVTSAEDDQINSSELDDGEDLLGNRSDADLTDTLGDYRLPTDSPPKEKRIADYSAVGPDESSLEGNSDDESTSEDDSVLEAEEGVSYAPQDDDTTDDGDEIAEQIGENAPSEQILEAADAVPMFEAAALAAVACNNGPPADQPATIPLHPAVKSVSPPPPPPPGGSPRKKSKRTPKSPKAGSTRVPLLAPPPEEKLKKWEESKQKSLSIPTRPPEKMLNIPEQSHSVATNSDTKPIASQSFEPEFPADTTEASKGAKSSEKAVVSRDLHIKTSDGPIYEAVTAIHVASPGYSDLAVMLTEDSLLEKPCSPQKSEKLQHANKTLSPVCASNVIQDTKLAEKVDLAISVAASKFEEHVSQSSSDVMVRIPSADELPGGAFSSWKNSGSDESQKCDNAQTLILNDCTDPTTTDVSDSKNDTAVPSASDPKLGEAHSISTASFFSIDANRSSNLSRPKKAVDDARSTERKYLFPPDMPSPFVSAVDEAPCMLSLILSFLGDPVAVCRVKMTNKSFHNYVVANEHKLMRDAVRCGGMSMNVRPYFWLWVTLQKNPAHSYEELAGRSGSFDSERGTPHELIALARRGRDGKWHSVIERDVTRSFGNLPPHKTGARLRTDSIVRALVTWGQNRLMKRGVKGCGEPPVEFHATSVDSDDVSLTPADTVSDWGGVTPVGSFQSSVSDCEAALEKHQQRYRNSKNRRRRVSQEDLALSGNTLTDTVKASLQDKLSFVLHSLAAAHPDVGYCQGMDYVVAHLLRILQDTIRWKAATGTLPGVIKSAPQSFYGQDMDPQQRAEVYAELDRSLVVEEACFRVMDSFFTSYNLRHFYWPELRCLKVCCLVFEKLISIKLPVLADHFEHHELNVGLFALGWFQTLFLYLPSMPTATVCHMWDIWLVERSFKIFFRVGTAILFLSQPILLNHELEGMMSYLNTFPDATLLSPDILIACALQIKVTNRMLMELEGEVTASL